LKFKPNPRLERSMSQEINYHRRRLFGAAALMIAAGQFVTIGSVGAQSGKTKPNATTIKPGSNTSFGPMSPISMSMSLSSLSRCPRAISGATTSNIACGRRTVPALP
jgi:hypothetical protein